MASKTASAGWATDISTEWHTSWSYQSRCKLWLWSCLVTFLKTYSDSMFGSLGARLRIEGDFPPSGSVSLQHPDSGSSATVASLSSEFMSAEKIQHNRIRFNSILLSLLSCKPWFAWIWVWLARIVAQHYNMLSVVIKLTTNIPYMWSECTNYARIMTCVEQLQPCMCFPGNFCAKQTDWSDSLSGQNPI